MSSDEAALQVDLAEFNALRSEIQTFITLQSAFLGLAIAVIAAVLTVADKAEVRPWLLAATPLTFAILGVLYADVVARIGRAARYIQTVLQPRFARQTAPLEALGWERYVHKTDPKKRLLSWTDRIRYAIFFLPAIVTYVISFWWPAPGSWSVFFKIVNGIALLGGCAVVRESESVVKEILSRPRH